MDAPKKYWWLVLVAVPIMVAIIGLAATVIPKRNSGSGAPGVSYVNYGGPQTNIAGDVAFNTLNVMLNEARHSESVQLTEDQIQILTAAMEKVEDRNLDAAIPLLESVAQSAPLPSVLNNLAAAYQAAGEVAKAKATLERAKSAQADSPQVTAAIQHNLRQVAASHLPPLLSPWQPGTKKGVVAAVTRCDDAGGMLTVEVTYRNASSDSIYLYVSPSDGYLLDEGTGGTWRPKVASAGHNAAFPADKVFISWLKFQLDVPLPKRLTLVAHHVQRGFENVPCVVSGR